MLTYVSPWLQTTNKPLCSLILWPRYKSMLTSTTAVLFVVCNHGNTQIRTGTVNTKRHKVA